MHVIRKIVDLSYEINEHTVVYPGDPQPLITEATSLEKDGYNLSRLLTGTQSGTHVDAPFHLRNSGNTIEKMDIKLFMGNAVLIDVSYKKANEEIMPEEIQPYEDRIKQADIVMFRTDWSRYCGEDVFFNNPFLSEKSAEYLLNMGIKTLVIDAINIDRTGGTHFPVHEMYSDANGIIAENLRGFDKIDFNDIFLIFLPLKITGTDGSPVRAVAVEFG